MTSLRLNSVSVSISGSPIVSDVSFSVEQGEVVGLIGPNGAGKSTVLRSILGIVEPEAGEILLGSERIADLDAKDRARSIAYVPQGAPVHWPLTAERTVALGRVPHLNPWQELSASDESVIENAMKQTDCWELRERLVTTLSGGERARVLLARTIAVGAQYLLADEPTASLDPEHQLQVMEIMKKQARADVGVVIVMHDLSLASRYCDKLVLLNEGNVIAEGTPKQVLTEENVAAAFNVKMAKWKEGATEFFVPLETV